MLYITSPYLFYNWKFVPFDPLPLILPDTTQPLQPLICSLYM